MATAAEVARAVRRVQDAQHVAKVVGGRAAERELAAARLDLRRLRLGAREAA